MCHQSRTDFSAVNDHIFRFLGPKSSTSEITTDFSVSLKGIEACVFAVLSA
ncbi:hypothetical protein VIBNIAM115_640007 [Vibrio nigripulchritudo AM115]|nr:hypothetical protein VIBNIAM115_640007 [Vibrio nigripulchritudo AM115]